MNALRTDYVNQVFGDYMERTLSYGPTLSSIEDGIRYNNLHEAMHYGQLKMLKLVLKAQ